MNKFVFTALVTTLASTTGFATETDWPELDRELEALSSTLTTQNTGGPQLSGWIISAIDFSGDVMPNGVDDLTGVSLRSVRLNVAGSTADYGYKVSTDLAGGTAVLLDAYGQLNFTENFSMQMGNFKTPFLASQMRALKRELFLERTFISGGSIGDLGSSVAGYMLADPNSITAGRDAGVMFFGNFADAIGWWLALQNGTDGTANNYRLTGRLAWDAMGEGAGQLVDGAYNSGDGTNVTIAVAYSEDSSETDATGTPLASMGNDTEQIGGEIYMTSGPFYLGGEIVSRGTNVGDNTPFTVTGSYLFNGDWEVALRYQGHDDTPVMVNAVADLAESTASVVLNKYVSGHDVKWQLQYANSSFTTADDIGVVSLGLVLAF